MQKSMSEDRTSITFVQTGQSTDARTRRTRALLACGMIAGPLYIAVGVLQILIRPGFDPTRNDLSQMSLGDLGWIQITNFIVTGLLVIACAVGMRRALRGSTGGTWGPLLLIVYGLGLIGAGFFTADPGLGFPPGTPMDAHIISWHGIVHTISGGLGFLGLIAACFVFARRFAGRRQWGWAAYSVATGVFFLAAFVGIATGFQQNGAALVILTLAFTGAVVIAWTWIAVLAARLRAGLA
ncbi:MAG TPA: DUF998 domain-containing protein [Ktedonobacteraceae bacterium]|jgi:hypothetical protein|nr:DUF998 domain-containing protein [Ktedonobacteraceae bacterium]